MAQTKSPNLTPLRPVSLSLLSTHSLAAAAAAAAAVTHRQQQKEKPKDGTTRHSTEKRYCNKKRHDSRRPS